MGERGAGTATVRRPVGKQCPWKIVLCRGKKRRRKRD